MRFSEIHACEKKEWPGIAVLRGLPFPAGRGALWMGIGFVSPRVEIRGCPSKTASNCRRDCRAVRPQQLGLGAAGSPLAKPVAIQTPTEFLYCSHNSLLCREVRETPRNRPLATLLSDSESRK